MASIDFHIEHIFRRSAGVIAVGRTEGGQRWLLVRVADPGVILRHGDALTLTQRPQEQWELSNKGGFSLMLPVTDVRILPNGALI